MKFKVLALFITMLLAIVAFGNAAPNLQIDGELRFSQSYLAWPSNGLFITLYFRCCNTRSQIRRAKMYFRFLPAVLPTIPMETVLLQTIVQMLLAVNTTENISM